VATKSSAKTSKVVAKAGDDYVKAKAPFHYMDLRLSRQQVFELRGRPGDARLIAMGYVSVVKKGTALHQCAECGALFDNPHWLKVHGDMWHLYKCECGWQPQPGVLDLESAMQRHARQCDLMQAVKLAAHKEHVAKAKEIQKAGGAEPAGA